MPKWAALFPVLLLVAHLAWLGTVGVAVPIALVCAWLAAYGWFRVTGRTLSPRSAFVACVAAAAIEAIGVGRAHSTEPGTRQAPRGEEAVAPARRCSEIGQAIDEGRVSAEDLDWIERSANGGNDQARSLVERLQRRTPSPEDLLARPDAIPCGSDLWPRLVGQLANAPQVWSSVGRVGDEMATALARARLSAESKAALRARTAEVATKQDAPPDLSARLCALVTLFDAGDVPACAPRPARAGDDAGSGEDAAPDASSTELRRLYAQCMVDCVKNRTPEQRAEDEALGREILAYMQSCAVKCGNDAGCERACTAARPRTGASASGCVRACQAKYPLPPASPAEEHPSMQGVGR